MDSGRYADEAITVHFVGIISTMQSQIEGTDLDTSSLNASCLDNECGSEVLVFWNQPICGDNFGPPRFESDTIVRCSFDQFQVYIRFVFFLKHSKLET